MPGQTFFNLHSFGFHLLWLVGKAPPQFGWTSEKPKPFKDWLASRGHSTNNVGVALGAQSPLTCGGFLACIDVDLKDATPEETKDLLKRVVDLLGADNMKHAPRVKSGLGYHVYFRSSQPFKSKTLVKSKRKIKNLDGTESAAWELAAYSSGRQMVLPPSIHPLTGERYSWMIAPESAEDFPLVDLVTLTGGAAAPTGGFEKGPHEPVGAVLSEVPYDAGASLEDFRNKIGKHHYYAIKSLAKVTDKSRALYLAVQALYTAGATHGQINAILSDEENELSITLTNHTKSNDFGTRLRWLDKYTTVNAIEDLKKRSHFQAIAKPIVPGAKSDEAEDFFAQQNSLDNGFHGVSPTGLQIPDHNALTAYFIESNGEVLTVADENEIFQWTDGKFYRSKMDLELKFFAQQNFNPTPSEQTRVEFVARVRSENVMTRESLEFSTLNKIAFENGVLDTVHKTLLNHSPSRFIRGFIPYDYDEDATCPVFEKWIAGIMCNDPELVSVLQEFMGYVIEGGSYSHHKLLWLSGTGRNGKSTFIDVLKALVGKENYISASLSSLMNDKFMAAQLDGKLLCASEEVNFGDYRDSGLIKTLTGDGEISAQRKFKPAFDFRNKAKMVQSLNELPQLQDLSLGMLSRIIIVPFNRTFTDAEQDKGIKEKLFAELPGIFNWALDGLARLRERGKFTEAKAGRIALDTVETDSSSVAQWVDHYVIQGDEKSFISTNEMYLHYRRVLPHPVNLSRFGRELARIKRLAPLKTNHDKKRGYRGVKLDLGL